MNNFATNAATICLLERLLRMLEHDELATGRRLLDLASDARNSQRPQLVAHQGPRAHLASRGRGHRRHPARESNSAARRTSPPSAQSVACVSWRSNIAARPVSFASAHTCTRRGATRRPELFELLADALQLFPQNIELHALVQEALAPKSDAETHRRWLDDLVDLRDGDERLRGRLYLGCAAVQSEPSCLHGGHGAAPS